jgi:hypothetical protein
MIEKCLKDKREGRYLTGFPAIGWHPETELGYGVVVEGFDKGARDDPFFDLTPYRSKFSIGVNATTGGFRQAGVDYDRPYFKDTPWRFRVESSQSLFPSQQCPFVPIATFCKALCPPWFGMKTALILRPRSDAWRRCIQ